MFGNFSIPVLFLQKMCTFAFENLAIMVQERPLHPILAQADEIAERGLVVFDDIRSMPLYDEPYTTDLMTISINLSGWVKAECDMRPVVFQPHDLAVVTPHHILCARESSADYHAMIIVLSPRFQEEMKHHSPDIYPATPHYISRQVIHLNDRPFPRIVDIFRLLRDVNDALELAVIEVDVLPIDVVVVIVIDVGIVKLHLLLKPR